MIDDKKYVWFEFWTEYLESTCARTSNGLLVLPRRSYAEFYWLDFAPWFARQVEQNRFPENSRPTKTTWKSLCCGQFGRVGVPIGHSHNDVDATHLISNAQYILGMYLRGHADEP